MEIKIAEYVVNLTVAHDGDSEPSYDALNLFLLELADMAENSSVYEGRLGAHETARREAMLSHQFLDAARRAVPEDARKPHRPHSVPYASEYDTIGISPSEF